MLDLCLGPVVVPNITASVGVLSQRISKRTLVQQLALKLCEMRLAMAVTLLRIGPTQCVLYKPKLQT